MRIKFVLNTIKYISLFESLSDTKVKDCFPNEGRLIFVVEQGMVGRALGKDSRNLRRIENMIKKKVKIIEFSETMQRFFTNLIFPARIADYSYDEDKKIIKVTAEDSMSRGFLIGRAATTLRNLEKIMQRYFDITEIKVA